MAERRPGSLAPRLISGLVLAPVAIGATLWSPESFAVLVAVFAVGLVWEWDRLCGGSGLGRTGLFLAAFLLAAITLAGMGLPIRAVAGLLVGALGCVALAQVSGLRRPFTQGLGALYIGLPVVSLVWLRTDAGWRAVLWLLVVVWATDIGAYAAGRLVGGPKLWPRLSPNKTWAGLAGGFTIAIAVGTGLAALYGGVDLALVAAASALLALVAEAGDLAESALKRRFQVKDTSSLIPGHGGLFDRVDSLLAAGPAMALLELASRGGSVAWR